MAKQIGWHKSGREGQKIFFNHYENGLTDEWVRPTGKHAVSKTASFTRARPRNVANRLFLKEMGKLVY